MLLSLKSIQPQQKQNLNTATIQKRALVTAAWKKHVYYNTCFFHGYSLPREEVELTLG